jgi:hypothetical protein
MFKLSQILTAVTMSLLLVGCTEQNNAAIRQTPTLTFANYGQISLPVNNVNVIPAKSRPGNETGYGILPIPLDQVGQRYAERRFAANGGVPTMTVTIADTRFEQTALRPGTKTGLDVLTMQRRQQIDIGMTIKIDIADGTKRTVTNEYRLDRKIDFAEDISLAERDMRLLNFTERFMADLDQRIVAGLREEYPNLGPASAPYIAPAPVPAVTAPSSASTGAPPADSAY